MQTSGENTRLEEQRLAVDAFLEARAGKHFGDHKAAEHHERCQERVLRAFENLVRHIAHGYRYQYRNRESIADLVQVGMIGMLTAMENFDPARGTPFAAFAANHIQYAIRHHLRDNTWALHVPRGAKELRAQVLVARQTLTQELDRSPSVAELAEFMQASTDDILQALLVDDATVTYGLEDVPASGRLDPGFDATEVQIILQDFLATRSANERQIFLLDLKGGVSQREIADRLGVSPSHVSRRLEAMWRELHARLHDDEPGDIDIVPR